MNRFFLPGTFFLGTLVLLFVYTQGTLKSRKTATTSGGKVPYMQVHQYKQETAMKIGIEKDQAQFRKESENRHLEPSDGSQNDFDDQDFKPEENIGSDIMDQESYQQAVTLDQKMDRFLAKKQQYEELETMKKKAYVEAFKREARAMGFVVEIDENMQIVSVKKLRK